jgi:glycine cleavage system H protein
VAALALLVALTLPLLGVLLFFTRAALLVTVIALGLAGIAAYSLSGRFRDWLQLMVEGQVSYKGLELATDVALAPGHAWARVRGPEAVVGVDDLAQGSLGPVDLVELPRPGLHVERGQPLFRLSSGRRTLTVRTPVGGTVVGVNDTLVENPMVVNALPFGEGWAVRLAGPEVRRDRRQLLRGLRARDWFRLEVDRLLATLTAEAVPTLPDGGVVTGELSAHVDDAAWEMLQESFFGRGGAAAGEPAPVAEEVLR